MAVSIHLSSVQHLRRNVTNATVQVQKSIKSRNQSQNHDKKDKEKNFMKSKKDNLVAKMVHIQDTMNQGNIQTIKLYLCKHY